MPETVKHTPTFPPLKTNAGRIVSAQRFGLASSITFAQCLGPDAAKIAEDLCRAANAHDQLVAACEAALKFLGGNCANPAIGSVLRAALTAAKEKP